MDEVLVILKQEEITTIVDALNCYIEPVEEGNPNAHKINDLIRYLQSVLD